MQAASKRQKALLRRAHKTFACRLGFVFCLVLTSTVAASMLMQLPKGRWQSEPRPVRLRELSGVPSWWEGRWVRLEGCVIYPGLRVWEGEDEYRHALNYLVVPAGSEAARLTKRRMAREKQVPQPEKEEMPPDLQAEQLTRKASEDARVVLRIAIAREHELGPVEGDECVLTGVIGWTPRDTLSFFRADGDSPPTALPQLTMGTSPVPIAEAAFWSIAGLTATAGILLWWRRLGYLPLPVDLDRSKARSLREGLRIILGVYGFAVLVTAAFSLLGYLF